ncbi:hypothetical protein L3Y34_017375 [Caenorhabditis briggsae]|uniref:Uncharacterized protein n=1 Tax=Caenorhabditis briggsae TaxID=6238 RepID=A0AAE9DHN1_CAEBR|nr:hypothetical protein L3Y34_017375 [Caenorhabditis briggsae]
MTDLQKLFVFHYNQNEFTKSYRRRLQEKYGLTVGSPISDSDYTKAIDIARQADQPENEAAIQSMVEERDERFNAL